MLLTESNRYLMTTVGIGLLERVAAEDNLPYEEDGGIIKMECTCRVMRALHSDKLMLPRKIYWFKQSFNYLISLFTCAKL